MLSAAEAACVSALRADVEVVCVGEACGHRLYSAHGGHEGVGCYVPKAKCQRRSMGQGCVSDQSSVLKRMVVSNCSGGETAFSLRLVPGGSSAT